MPKYRFDIEQNTKEWDNIKLGKFSASTSNELLMDKKNKGYKKLIRRLTEERITGKPCENKWDGNQFTERGHELQDVAIERYELDSFKDVVPVGVVELNDYVLCSPDGLIDDNGLIQIKCPIFSTQWDYIESEKIPTNYKQQMMFELFVTGRDYNIFYSYHPSLKPVKIILERDEDMISAIAERIDEANKDVLMNINLLSTI